MSLSEGKPLLQSNRPLAVSSWCWHHPFYFDPAFTLFDVPARAAALGIHHVELNDFMLPPPRLSRIRERWRPLFRDYPAAWWHYTAGNMKRLQQALQAADVQCICWTLDTDLTAAERVWRKQQTYIRYGVWAAQKLGTTRIRLTLGGEPEMPAGIDPLVIERLAVIGRAYPAVQFVVENHGGLTADIGRMLAILAQVPLENVGVCFDPGNVPPEQREDMWPRLAALASHFHLKTHKFDSEGQETTIPYRVIFELLNKHQYGGDVVIEYEGSGSPFDGISHSQKLIGKKSEVSGYRAIAETPRGGA